MKIAIGSTVWLKSGSPDLKVIDISGHYVMVSWLEGDGTENRDIFKNVSLVSRRPANGNSTLKTPLASAA
jgi:uncharacterized protein YodC (DUF2158 family)